MHRAGVGGRLFGLTAVEDRHLRDEGQGLVGLALEVGLDPLAFGRELGIDPQLVEGRRRLADRFAGDGDPAELVGVVGVRFSRVTSPG